jgi:glycine/serine hydroxymethyltransferase
VATAELVRRSGRRSVLVDFDQRNLTLALDHLAALRTKHDIRLAFLDEGAPLYPLPFAEIRRVLGADVTMVYDASHALGLLLGGVFGAPIADGCDVVQGNTHKTFPGPQKALMHFADAELGQRTMQTVGEALVSSQHTHQAAALYFAALEMDLFGAAYARQIVANARALSLALERTGHELLRAPGRYTESHQVLLKLPAGMGALDACTRLADCGISVNAKHLYGHHVLRLGVQEITRRGLREPEMLVVAELLGAALAGSEPVARLQARATWLRRAFDQIHYSFDTLEPAALPLASTSPARLSWTAESTSR